MSLQQGDIRNEAVADEVGAPAVGAGEPVVLHYQLEAEDLIAASAVLSDVDPSVMQAIRMHMIVLPLMLLAATVLLIWLMNWTVGVLSGVLAIYYFLAARRVTRRAVANKVRKDIESGNHRDFDLPTKLEADASGFRTQTSNSESQLSWKQIRRVITTADCLFIYLSHRNAIVVPRRCVIGGDYDAFVEGVGRFVTVQHVKAGATFEEALHKDEAFRRERQKSRVLRAFLLGMLGSLVAGGLTYQLMMQLFPFWGRADVYMMFVSMVPAGVGIGIAVWRATQLTQLDHETRCRRCQYILKSLVEPRCPECGEII